MRAAIVLWVLWVTAAHADVHGVPLPRGTRSDGDRHVSPLGFRAAIDWYQALWRRRGVAVRTVGPYQVRGVDVVRFLPTAPSGPWLAVQVYKNAGKTQIFVVPRATLDGDQPTE